MLSQTTVKDPVCGMDVIPSQARGWDYLFEGTVYHFCGPNCRAKFQAEPKKYTVAQSVVSKTSSAIQDAQMATIYTCPMHQQIRQNGPGSCTICGMALEALNVSAEDPVNSELIEMSRRFWIGLLLSVPLLAMAMAEMQLLQRLPGLMRPWPWIEMALATPVVLWGGWPFFEKAWASLRDRHFNMFTLIALGTGTAYFYSLVATLFPTWFASSLQGQEKSSRLYFESAAVITTFVLLGQVLELKARSQTSGAIRSLLGLSPKTARRLNPAGSEEEIALTEIRVGDRLRVRPGEKVPADGILLEGTTTVDESMISGEAVPIEKVSGSRLIGATLNGTGSVVMRADRVGSETVLSQIVQMVSQAQRSRAPIQRLSDRVSSYFVPAVILVAFLTFGAWAYWGPQPRLAHAVINAVAVLIIACPCALGLAAPMSVMVGTGKGATAGILIKDAGALEILSKVDTLVFDKTGTLTEGKPRLTSIAAAEGFEESELLRLAASLEQGSEHPFAAAIVGGAKERGLPLSKATDFLSLSGKGIKGIVDERRIFLGNAALFSGYEVPLDPITAQVESLRQSGQTILFVAIDGKMAGTLALSDPVKGTTAQALQLLHEEGLRIVMLSGDHRATAEAVAKGLLIDEIVAELLPNQKRDKIRALQGQGHVVAMAGDGINDAPALMQAQVGIAMGTGTDVAMKSAGITLMKGDLLGIVKARHLSRMTMRNIQQNLFFSFAYNSLGIPVAAGLLYPFFGILLSPMLASAAMSLSSLSVILNALRLRKLKL